MFARAATLLVLLLLGCARAVPKASEPARTVVTSNVLRSDYAGSASCAPCHAELYAKWRGSPMHQMTRLESGAQLQAPFDGGVFRFKGDEARMETVDGQRLLHLSSPRGPERVFRVTKVLGGRTREDLAGVELRNPFLPEQILPVTWVFSTQSWRYKGYSTMNPERPYLAVGPTWRQTCIFCHNTPPLLSSLLDELHGPGAPAFQGSTGETTLPADRRLQFHLRNPAGLSSALSAELAVLGAPAPDAGIPAAPLLSQTIRATRARFDQQHLVEIGIGCEACHGGSREHADNPSVLPSYLPLSPLFDVAAPDGGSLTRSQAINRVCERCHSVLFSKYPWAWEGATRSELTGGSHINSGEGRDLLLGGCASQLDCTRCHDPHQLDDRAKLEQLGTVAGNGVCTGCHPAFATPVALTAHSHHLAQSEGSACLSCHLPRKNVGLEYGATRYHRIGSPTDAARVERDRPLECALCHTDRSVEQLLATMERWWGKRFGREAARVLYGPDLGVNVLLATLQRGKPHEQLAAISALGERPIPGALEALAGQLLHPTPLVRFQAGRALERASGRPLGLDLHLSAAELEPQVRRWLVDKAPAIGNFPTLTPTPPVEDE